MRLESCNVSTNPGINECFQFSLPFLLPNIIVKCFNGEKMEEKGKLNGEQ